MRKYPKKSPADQLDSQSYLKAESSFTEAVLLKQPPSMRRDTGRPLKMERVRTAIAKYSTVEYFRSILDDETEKELWLGFLTGRIAVKNRDGSPVMEEENGILYPKFEKVELNPISLKAFLRAVEYKRGMPVVTVETEDGNRVKLELTVMGASPEFFEQQAKAAGLIR